MDMERPVEGSSADSQCDPDRRARPAITEKIDDLTSIASALLEEIKSLTVDVRGGVDFYDEVKKFEMDLIKRALNRTQGHQTKAAQLLKIKITTLNSKIKRYNIEG